MSEPQEPIERGIRELTRRRELHAPDFDRLVERPPGALRKGSRMWSWAAASAATAAALLVVVLVQHGSSRTAPNGTEWEQSVVAEWRAPTDVFLPDPDPPWLRGAPPLGRANLIVYTADRSSDLEVPSIDEESP